MELLINCNASVNLIGLQSVKKVMCEFKEYNVENDLLEGKVLIYGVYINTDNEEKSIEKEIPITIVFKEEGVKITDVCTDNFKYYEIVNQGIECEFISKLIYEEIMEEPFEENISKINDVVIDNEFLIDDEDGLKQENEKEEIYETIVEEYDDKLDNILNDRGASITEEENKLSINEIVKENNRVSFKGIRDNYGSYRVYYINDERKLETISKSENKSFEEIYRTNQDLEAKKRIILK